MKRAVFTHNQITRLVLLIWLGTIFYSCAHKGEDITPSIEYAPYINAYTGGVISSANSTIRIELAQDQPMVEIGSKIAENPFYFSPTLKGEAQWIDSRTIEFIPEKGSLKPGDLYKAEFDLGRFVDVDKRLEKFIFSFRVLERNFTLSANTDLQFDAATIEGTLLFSDAMSKEEVKGILTTDNAATIEVSATEQPNRYQFQIRQIERKDQDYRLKVIADGEPIGVDHKEELEVLIPARSKFRFLDAQYVSQSENGIMISFSDPVSTRQNLNGLIEIKEIPHPVFQVKGNKVFVYFEATQSDNLTLQIHEGIQNEHNEPLGTSHTLSLDVPSLKPQVEMSSSAAILPDSKNLVVPFRAVNLRAVDVSIIRIFEKNVLMFMQSNSLSSANELRRSGRLIYRKTLQLDGDPSKNVHQWENYSLDLTGLIHQEPGAIYRVILSFRQEYSAYPCGGEESGTPLTEAPSGFLTRIGEGTPSEQEEAEWDVPNAYYYYSGNASADWSLYNWKERNNPCHPTYYMMSERAASCNVYASNLGVIVKRNTLNKLWITVNDILSTRPVKEAEITVYNFQLQPIGKGQTDGEGFAEIAPEGVPFIIVAESEGQKGYVRVVEGEELSVSRFDVGGKDIPKGLKGFIYGERGVWRPGDTLHVSFILEDRKKRIPDKHPVSLEIYNPKGQFYTKTVSTQGVNGLYAFHIPTKASDPTGTWQAYVKVGGSTFHKSLLIETVKANRLKINLNVPGVVEAGKGKIPVSLSSSWLTGAKASRLKAKVEMSLSKVNTQFKDYPSYSFNDPATDFTSVKSEVFSGVLDTEGKTSFNLSSPSSAQAPGMLNATFTTRVFEPGGDASVYTQTVPYSPYASYVGIDLNQPQNGKHFETDQDLTFDVVTVDCRGNAVSRSNLEYRVYKIDWSWWWEKNDNSFSNYVNSSSITPIASGNLQTDKGKTNFKFRINYPEWGRYLIYVKDKESGHATGGTIYVDWPEWRGRSKRNNPDGIQMLSFSLDKESYEIGETVTAIIPASAGGRALLSLENGSTVLWQKWTEVSEKQDTKITFEATPEMAPNAYLHISLLQPHAQTVNDLPIRMYGIVPVFVTNRQTVLQPRIDMAETLRPETDFKVTVSEKDGRPMTYTLAVVDEGLLDLTNFKTPEPWNEFYAREALGIRTWDMYDNVLGAFAGKYPSLFSIGGDATLKPADTKANRFKPVVKFVGPFYIGKNERRTHTLRLPMYVGSIRAMVVAAQDGAYGQAEKTVSVKAPLMMLSTLPRRLSTQEEITVPVNIFAMENQVKEVSVSIQASGDCVRLNGSSQQTLTFNQPGDQLCFFNIRTTDRTGKATIRLTANGNGMKTHETIEIEVLNPNPIVTLRKSQWVDSGKEVEIGYQAAPSSVNNQVYLEVSRIPSVDINRRLTFLYGYQHQCTEQLTSKVLPLLFINRFKTVEEQELKEIKEKIQEGTQQIYARQLSNGGFTCWPSSAVADEWVTSYAGMFLLLAQEEGYAVHPSVLAKWKRFQRMAAQNWRTASNESEWQRQQSELQQAFRLYTLALAGTPEYGAMNRMKEQKTLSAQAKWRLAAAYALTGKIKPAEELVFSAKTTVTPYAVADLTYGSSDRDEAMILETLLLMNRTEEAMRQAQLVSRNLSGEDSFNTQSTAFALMAMGRLAEKLSGTLAFTWKWNGKQQPTVKSTKAVFEQELANAGAKGSVSVRNEGDGALNVDVITRTQPLNDTLPAISNHLRLNVSYTDIAGAPISIDDIKQGSDFTAMVTVANISNSSDYKNLALTHILPSGWEIYDTYSNGGTAQTYQDVRDDRVLTYFDLRRGEQKTFAVRLQATYLGTFVLPAIQCEAMYDSSVQARTKAGKTTVSK